MTDDNKIQANANQTTPKRITLRHLSGSRAHQVEDFPLDQFKELVIGRSPSAAVKYNPNQDDLVSREHAKIVPDPTDPAQFTLQDLNSRNGTYLNKQRLVDSAKIQPGDVIQLGPGGPEFEFDMEPRPEERPRPTRLIAGDAVMDPSLTPTRVIEGGIGQPPAVAQSGDAPAPVGKTTVMRMIAQINHTARKQMIAGAAALLLLIAGVAGYLMYQKKQMGQEMSQQISEAKAATRETKTAMEAAAAAAPATPAAIARAATNAAVFMEVGWKLIYTPTGGQVYHEYVPVKDDKDQTKYIAAYLLMPDGSVEPSLTLESGQGRNKAIGGMHTGSGFVVTNDGFILTNRHVAASWNTRYDFPPDALPGALFELGQEGKKFKSVIKQTSPWVPAEAKAVGRAPVSGKLLEGRNDYLDVTFAKNELRMPAKLVRVSNRHDVAMVKVDTPQSLTKAELFDNYDNIRPGDAITVLGYPAVSPEVVVGTRSNDPFNPQYQRKVVPDPTVTGGLVGRVIRGEQAPSGRDKYDYMSFYGDSYQLTVNSTGGGNSGGPVFDDRGRVVGIFFAGKWDAQGTKISFAVPIRYGIELMGTTPVLR